MPAIDSCQAQVLQALHKQGWQVIEEPVPIRLDDRRMTFADALLRKPQLQQQIIVVEIKCFVQKRVELDDFYQAVGQYLFYRNALALENVYTPLYLAIPDTTYTNLFKKAPIQATLKDAKIKLIIVNLVDEEVVSWID
jgi:hypothetical protein